MYMNMQYTIIMSYLAILSVIFNTIGANNTTWMLYAGSIQNAVKGALRGAIVRGIAVRIFQSLPSLPSTYWNIFFRPDNLGQVMCPGVNIPQKTMIRCLNDVTRDIDDAIASCDSWARRQVVLVFATIASVALMLYIAYERGVAVSRITAILTLTQIFVMYASTLAGDISLLHFAVTSDRKGCIYAANALRGLLFVVAILVYANTVYRVAYELLRKNDKMTSKELLPPLPQPPQPPPPPPPPPRVSSRRRNEISKTK